MKREEGGHRWGMPELNMLVMLGAYVAVGSHSRRGGDRGGGRGVENDSCGELYVAARP